MHPLGAGSGVAVVSDDGQLLRPQGMQCYFPAPDNVQEAQELPPNNNPNPKTNWRFQVPGTTAPTRVNSV